MAANRLRSVGGDTAPKGTEVSRTPCLPPAWMTDRPVPIAERLDEGEIP